MDSELREVDPDIADAVERELGRQRDTLELIASENFAPLAVLQAQGSVLTNKYAEGYPGRRYYGGCEYVDVVESLAIERAKRLFGAEHTNVQPHAGAQASAGVLSAFAEPGDAIVGLDLAHGGHLTHGMKLNFSGKIYRSIAYHVDADTGLVDMDEVRSLARRRQPAVLIAGWSAYPRHLDFAAFREVADEVGATLWVDMAHFAGLVAAGLHPSPIPYARRHHDHAQDARGPSLGADPLPRPARQAHRLQRVPRTAGWPVGFQNSATNPDLGFYAACSYSPMRLRTGSAVHPLLGEVSDGVARAGGADGCDEEARTRRPSRVRRCQRRTLPHSQRGSR
jgi:glycine hydroxymethyltransferase